MIAKDFVAEVDVERHNRDAGSPLLLLSQVSGRICNDPDHEWSIASGSRPSRPTNGAFRLVLEHLVQPGGEFIDVAIEATVRAGEHDGFRPEPFGQPQPAFVRQLPTGFVADRRDDPG
jgi:hypothetical protein